MTVMLVGGGTGGHITPLLAVARELRRKDPNVTLVYLEEKDGRFGHLATQEKGLFNEVVFIKAGKLRRYPNESKLRRALDIKTHVLNTRDMARTAVGYTQAQAVLKRIKPDIVFIKGSFVGVPVGKACKSLKVPYITHDSDTVPGLTNRLIAKDARLNLVGMPLQFYNYPKEKMRYTGIPLSEAYANPKSQAEYRKQLKLSAGAPIILITGGSSGAERLNGIAAAAVKVLLTDFPELVVVHQTGKGKGGLYSSLRSPDKARVKEYEYLDDLAAYSGAADLVVARAGATTICELAAQHKASVLVPSIYLAGGHQLENAQYFSSKKAALVVDESDPEAANQLASDIRSLLNREGERSSLGNALHALVSTSAASDIADILLRKAQAD